MDLKNLFLGALIGTIIGGVIGLVLALMVSGDNYRVMFLMTFTEVGLIVGLLWSAKSLDSKHPEFEQ